jgi:hypothetical protein
VIQVAGAWSCGAAARRRPPAAAPFTRESFCVVYTAILFLPGHPGTWRIEAAWQQNHLKIKLRRVEKLSLQAQ